MADDVINMDLGLKLPPESDFDGPARGANKLADSIDKAAKSLERAVGPNEKLIASQRQLNNELNEGGISFARYRDLSNAVAQAQQNVDRANKRLAPPIPEVKPPPIVKPSGPNERLAAAEEKLKQVLADPSGVSDSQIKDLQYAVFKSRKSVKSIEDQMNPPAFNYGKEAASALYSSRIGGANGGLMPLLGKSLDAVSGGQGMAILSNPYVLAGAAVVEFGKRLYETSQKAAEAGEKFASVGFATGGSGRETAQIQAFGDAIGRNLEGAARNLNERITSDPTARGVAGQMGVYNTPGMYGNQNYASQLLRVVENLRKITDQQERIRLARVLGVEDALPLTNLSDTSFRGLKRDAEIRERIIDPEFQKQSQDFQAESGRAVRGLEDISTALGKKFIPALNVVLRQAGNAGEGLANAVNNKSIPELSFDLGQLIMNPLPTLARMFVEGSINYGASANKEGSSSSSGSNVAKELIEALTGLTKAIRSQRAKDAMPGSIGGAQIQRLSELGALQFSGI